MRDDEAKRISKLEADNSVKQASLAEEIIRYFLEPDRPFALRPSHIKQMQAAAVDGIVANPGQWRGGQVIIIKSTHEPPGPHLVEHLVQEMCDYVNENFHEKTALHLAAYVMWRLNWIHPFSDGNGRTSRAVSYIVLCSHVKILLPGTSSIPQQIEENRAAYFRALEAADEALRETDEIDISVMEETLKSMLATQLLSVINKADGGANTS